MSERQTKQQRIDALLEQCRILREQLREERSKSEDYAVQIKSSMDVILRGLGKHYGQKIYMDEELIGYNLTFPTLGENDQNMLVHMTIFEEDGEKKYSIGIEIPEKE